MSDRGRRHRRQLTPSLLAGWKAQPPSFRLLRGFLGVTFVYAGIQKLADPTFFDPGSPTYIGAQLKGFAEGSPIGGSLTLLSHFATVAGVGVAFTEIAIGVATLLGIGALIAAAAGCGLSVALFLSASWHVHPYFLGSDSIYAVAWLALLLGMVEMRRRAAGKKKPRRSFIVSPSDLSRREFVRGGALALFTLATGGVAWALAGKAKPALYAAASAAASDARARPAGTRPASSGPSSKPAPASSTQPPPPAGVEIATLDKLSVGQAIPFDAPGVGACALIRTSDVKCEAYSRTCTHQGCEIGWNPSAQLLVCPCHGAEFDPAQGGKPVRGPALRPLQKVDVVVDRRTGQVILPQ